MIESLIIFIKYGNALQARVRNIILINNRSVNFGVWFLKIRYYFFESDIARAIFAEIKNLYLILRYSVFYFEGNSTLLSLYFNLRRLTYLILDSYSVSIIRRMINTLIIFLNPSKILFVNFFESKIFRSGLVRLIKFLHNS